MGKTLPTAMAVLVLGAAGAVGVASPAQAYEGECDRGAVTGYFCGWGSPNYSGGLHGYAEYNDSNYGDGSGEVMYSNNVTESWRNHGYAGTYDDVRVYQYENYGGYSFCVARGGGVPVPGRMPNGVSWANQASSHKWVSSC